MSYSGKKRKHPDAGRENEGDEEGADDGVQGRDLSASEEMSLRVLAATESMKGASVQARLLAGALLPSVKCSGSPLQQRAAVLCVQRTGKTSAAGAGASAWAR